MQHHGKTSRKQGTLPAACEVVTGLDMYSCIPYPSYLNVVG